MSSQQIRLRFVCDVNPPARRFRSLAEDAPVTFLPMEAVWPDERLDVSRVRLKREVSRGFTTFDEGDLLLPQITPTFEARRAAIARGLRNGAGAGTTELHVIRPGQGLDLRYAFYVVNSDAFVARGSAEMRGVAGQKRIPADFVRDYVVDLPATQIQQQLAAALDAATRRLAVVEGELRRLESLLEEKRDAYVITHALRGRGDAALGPSASGLYPGVPLGWEEVRLGLLECDVQTGPFGSQLHAHEYTEGGWPVVNPVNLDGGTIRADPEVAISGAKRAALARHVLRPGDIVVARRGEMGRSALTRREHAGWVCGTGCLRIRVTKLDRVAAEYLALLLSTPPARAYFEASSVGTTMDNLNRDIVRDFPVLLPPISVQRQIVDDVRVERLRTDSLILAIRQQRTWLYEYRRALVHETVTVKRQVRGETPAQAKATPSSVPISL